MNANSIHEIPGGKIIDKNLSNEEILVLWLKDIGSQSNESLKYVHDQRGHAIRGVDDTPATMKNNWDVKLCFPDFGLLAAMMFADLLYEFIDQAVDAVVGNAAIMQKLNPELVS